MTPSVTPEPLAVDARGLAALLSLGLRTVRSHDARGLIPAGVTIGGRKLWPVDEIRAWLSAGGPPRSEWEIRKRASRKN